MDRFDAGKNGRRGTMSEIMAVTWLFRKGYETFRNVCNYGPIDIIAMNGNEMLFIDVKTARPYTKIDGSVSISCTSKLTKEQEKYGVVFLYVVPDYDEIAFSLKDIERRVNAS